MSAPDKGYHDGRVTGDGRSVTCPRTRPVVVESIPSKLRALEQWAAWRWQVRGNRWIKAPVNPGTGGYARSNDPDTWSSFEAALSCMRSMRKGGLAGVGFMFHPNDPFAGVDLDGCRNLQTGEIEARAMEVVRFLHSYTEISPSLTGLKIFVAGELPPGRRRKGQTEMYDRGRFFTTTGLWLEGTPRGIRSRQEELTDLHRCVFGENEGTAAKSSGGSAAGVDLSDQELLDRAMRARNGRKFSRLWAGDANLYANGTNEGRSEADLALCSLLAFWTGPDEERVDRLFRQSGLYREKWARRADYRALTLAVALGRDEFWTGSGVRGVAGRRGTVDLGPPTPGAGVAGKADHRLG